jgi:hypothetical protein
MEGLMPFRATTLELAYGDMEYVRSVFGPKPVSRLDIIEYYDNAKMTWSEIDYTGLAKSTVTKWCRSNRVRPLHYYAPEGMKTVWFKDAEDAFAFKLKFGV